MRVFSGSPLWLFANARKDGVPKGLPFIDSELSYPSPFTTLLTMWVGNAKGYNSVHGEQPVYLGANELNQFRTMSHQR